MKSVCVFCGSSRSVPQLFFISAMNMGSALGKRNLELVFGGAGTGLMKALADGAIDSGGRVVGVMPRAWAPRRAHLNISRLELVDSIQERKRRMLSLSDAFLALPGGFGTLDEFTEVITLAQLGVHHKPCGILNVNGYFDVFLDFLDEMNTYGFIDSSDKNAIIVEHEPDRILDIMATKAGSPP